MARIAINGFGRIGRLVFRTSWLRHPELEIVAINDPAGTHTDALLLEYDSNYGPFAAKIESAPGALYVDGRKVTVFRERDWTKLRWPAHQLEHCRLAPKVSAPDRDRRPEGGWHAGGWRR